MFRIFEFESRFGRRNRIEREKSVRFHKFSAPKTVWEPSQNPGIYSGAMVPIAAKLQYSDSGDGGPFKLAVHVGFLLDYAIC